MNGGSVVNEVTFVYNDFAQLTTEYQAHSGAVNTSTTPKVQYGYADGSANTIRPTTMTYPGGRVLTYGYGSSGGTNDACSRIESLIDHDAGSTHPDAYVSARLEEPYEMLLRMLCHESRLNADETGHNENGRRMWTWCFRAYLYTVYKISPSRGSDVLLDVLGKEFAGVLGCDYFSAYRKYMRLNENVALPCCLAHLIRDVKFLISHPDAANRLHGQRLLDDLRQLFRVIHRREQYASPETFRRALEVAKADLVWDATIESPHTREALALEARFYPHTDSYFRFITEPGVDPTNNVAEQAIRFVAIHRRITQGTRSVEGRRWCERIWTVIQTCGQQGRSVYEFLCAAVESHFRGRTAPSLIVDST